MILQAEDDGEPELSAQMDISVTVVDVNEAPVAVAMPPIELTTRPMPWMVDLREYFADPDGDTLAYKILGAASTDVAHAAADGGTLSITPAGEGSSSFYMVAADPGGLRVINKVSVSVIDPAPALTPVPAKVTTPVAAATPVMNALSMGPQETPSAVGPMWALSERRYRNFAQQPDRVSPILVAFAVEPVVDPVAEVSLPPAERPAPPPKTSPIDTVETAHSPAPISASLDASGGGLTTWPVLLVALIALVTAGYGFRMYVIHRL